MNMGVLRSTRTRMTLTIVLAFALFLAGYTAYTVRQQQEITYNEHLNHGIILARAGAASAGQVLELAIKSRQLTQAQVFDRDYVETTVGNSVRYYTAYDSYTDRELSSIVDHYTVDPTVVYALLVDVGGYIPTADSNNADIAKTIADSDIQRLAADNRHDYLQQEYTDNAGTVLWDISSPVYVNEEYWGVFRIGVDRSLIMTQLVEVRNRTLSGLGLVGLVVAIVVFMISSYMVRPINRMIQLLREIASGDGDLTVRIPSQGSDETSRVAYWFNDFISRLQHIVGATAVETATVDDKNRQLVEAIQEVETVTSDIVSTTHSLNESTAEVEQDASTAESTINELTQTVAAIEQGISHQQICSEKSVASVEALGKASQLSLDATHQLQELVRKTATVVAEGTQSAGQTVTGIETIDNTASHVARAVKELGTKSESIAAIVEVIGSVAKQTNLLALNASIEAARAGEKGKGFSVVADEIRRLAETSAESTGQIEQLVEEIVFTINDSVSAITDGMSELQRGMELAVGTKQVLTDISEHVDSTSRAVHSLVETSTSVSNSREEILQAVSTVAHTVRDSMKSTHDMVGQTGRLKETIGEISAVSNHTHQAASQVESATLDQSSAIKEINTVVSHLTDTVHKLRFAITQFKS